MKVPVKLSAKLTANLQQLSSLHSHLLLVMTKELDLKADCELSQLEAIQQRKLEIADLIQTLEQNRQGIVQEIADSLNLDNTKRISLKVLMLHFTGDQQKELTDLQETLKASIYKIKALAKEISNISKARLISLKETTNQIDKWMAYHTLYSRYGSLTNKPQTRFLSRHI